MLLLLTVVLPVSVLANTYIPPQAFIYRSDVNKELVTYFPEIPHWNYIPALIEHESCITLKHSKCWNPTSTLNTSREYAVGFGQLTKAYKEDGTVRFDSLKDMRNKYRYELKELAWETLPTRPDLQIRTIVLMTRDNYKSLYDVPNKDNRLHMSDAAYNGGLRGLINERRACNLASGCDPMVWFDHVEKYCLKSKKVLYGSRNACDINRHHVRDVVLTRMPKYQKRYFDESWLKLNSIQGARP